jgi:hypothetical protein
MSVTVSVTKGRLIIKDNGALVSDMAGPFIEAETNGKSIFVITAEGRLKELRLDGRFVHDIVGSGAVRVRCSGDVLVVTKNNGRTEEYRDGRQIRSY